MYEALIEFYKNKELSFSDVKTFNLDEYCGLKPDHPKSYRFFMNDIFFNHIDINKNNTYIPSGIGNINENSSEYEKLLDENPIDLQVLGIGTNAHIGFNEPDSSFDSITRKVNLTKETIKVNTRFFNSADEVPKTAISMGIATILKAKKIILIASGKNKAHAIKGTVEGNINTDIPSSSLQNHSNVELFLDEDAASFLKKY